VKPCADDIIESARKAGLTVYAGSNRVSFHNPSMKRFVVADKVGSQWVVHGVGFAGTKASAMKRCVDEATRK